MAIFPQQPTEGDIKTPPTAVISIKLAQTPTRRRTKNIRRKTKTPHPNLDLKQDDTDPLNKKINLYLHRFVPNL